MYVYLSRCAVGDESVSVDVNKNEVVVPVTGVSRYPQKGYIDKAVGVEESKDRVVEKAMEVVVIQWEERWDG